MSVNKSRRFIKKASHFNGLDKLLKLTPPVEHICSTMPLRPLKPETSIFANPYKCSDDNNLQTLSRGVLPPVKYSRFWPISTLVISMDSMADTMYIQGRLKKYCSSTPRSPWHQCSESPMTATGKILKKDLKTELANS
jgi:hypothetical protein